MKPIYTKEVQEELDKIAPLLSGLPKDNPFQVPSGYFSDVEDKILSQIYLTDFDHTSPVPHEYFEDVENQIVARINTSNTSKGDAIFISLSKYKYHLMSTAAVMAFVLTAWFVISKIEKPETAVLAETTQEESLEYLHPQISDQEIDMLVDQGIITEEDLVIDFGVQADPSDVEGTWLDSEINF